MLQRIRYALPYDFTDSLDGEVEADETYVGGKNRNHHASKKTPNSQGRSSNDKTVIVGMVERKGLLTASIVDNVKFETLSREVIKNVKKSAVLYTDEWLGYNGLKRIYGHSIVKHNKREYVNGRVHTNTIEGFWSLLKRGIFGIYHFNFKKYFQKYVDEFVFRYNTRDISESFRFQFYLSNCEGKLTYKQLTN